MTQKNRGRRHRNYYCRFCGKPVHWQAAQRHADEHVRHSPSTKESST